MSGALFDRGLTALRISCGVLLRQLLDAVREASFAKFMTAMASLIKPSRAVCCMRLLGCGARTPHMSLSRRRRLQYLHLMARETAGAKFLDYGSCSFRSGCEADTDGDEAIPRKDERR
jgi:hypothetical protein